MTTPAHLAPEFALYHPWPPLDGHTLGEWVKTMLLFFEGVAIPAPPVEGEQLVSREEEILAPLADRGLFRVLDPGDLIQKHEAEAILEFLFIMTSSLDGKIHSLTLPKTRRNAALRSGGKRRNHLSKPWPLFLRRKDRAGVGDYALGGATTARHSYTTER